MPAIRSKSETLAVGDAYKALAPPFEFPSNEYPNASSHPSSPSSCASSLCPATPVDSSLRKPAPEDVTATSQKFIDSYRNTARTRTHSPDKKNTVTRPPNAFILFRSWFLTVMPQTTERRQNVHSKTAGQQWSTMRSEEKEPWQNEARRLDEEHQAIFPDYKYAPSPRKSPKTPRKRHPATASPKVDSKDEDDTTTSYKREMETEMTKGKGMAMTAEESSPLRVHGVASIATPPETPQKAKARSPTPTKIPTVDLSPYGLPPTSTAFANRTAPTSPVLSNSKKPHPRLRLFPTLHASPEITVEQSSSLAGFHPATSTYVSQFGQPGCWGTSPTVTTHTFTAGDADVFDNRGFNALSNPTGPFLFNYNPHSVLPDSEKFLNSNHSNVFPTQGEMTSSISPPADPLFFTEFFSNCINQDYCTTSSEPAESHISAVQIQIK